MALVSWLREHRILWALLVALAVQFSLVRAAKRMSVEEARAVRAHLSRLLDVEEPPNVKEQVADWERYSEHRDEEPDDSGTGEETTRQTYTPESARDGRLLFKVPALEIGEKIVSAELHVAPWHVNELVSEQLRQSSVLRLNLDHVLEPASNQDQGHDSTEEYGGQTRLQRMNSELFLPRSSEWCVLDVLSAVRRWTAPGGNGTGQLRLTVSAGPEVVGSSDMLEQLLRAEGTDPDLKKTQPVLHVTVSGGDPPRGRERRSAPLSPSENELLNRHHAGCNAYALKITVEEIGWEGFIFKPRVFSIGYCAGHCYFPLPQSIMINTYNESSNYSFAPHTVFQAFANMLSEGAETVGAGTQMPYIPPTSCAAVRYDAPLDIMYFTLTGKLSYKRYHNISLLACGCA